MKRNKDYYMKKRPRRICSRDCLEPSFYLQELATRSRERAGYMQAREEWKAANPGADELKAMFNKNDVFCMKALDH